MEYFLTGGTGFIGGHLAPQLLDEGHDVVALARTPSTAGALAPAGATVVEGDITDRSPSFQTASKYSQTRCSVRTTVRIFEGSSASGECEVMSRARFSV